MARKDLRYPAIVVMKDGAELAVLVNEVGIKSDVIAMSFAGKLTLFRRDRRRKRALVFKETTPRGVREAIRKAKRN